MRNKTKLVITYLILLISCKPEVSNHIASQKEVLPKPTIVKSNDSIDSTLHKDLKLDSIIIYNKKKREAFYFRYYKTGNDLFDKAIKDSVLKYNQSFIDYYLDDTFVRSIRKARKGDSEDAKYPNYFSIDPLELWQDSNYISINFSANRDIFESAHPVEFYYSFNFDKKRNKLISFNDFFTIKTRKDSLFLINLIEKSRDSSSEFFLYHLYNINFTIVNDTIKFNFGDYEIGPYCDGVSQICFPKKKLLRIINKNYR